ncbi:hypothetical protein BB934_45250 (plasmid) [Microvirga ossetica]|uniref:DUF4007 domain-containing protein n=1 Tax=Microvirga ossetica TaxID=1882682 RepID=A0A1B2EZK7_9HYPH|nr:DUF4007 family protein [Microvirga ossetica]ANY85429.1 hypothetical protein BB934_45250 [Microvirga ossetica]
MRAAVEEARRKYEFGRHETFTIREGWLSKGLARLSDTDSFKADLETADALGLGSRMIKSLQYWLEATGMLAFEGDRKRKDIRLSDLGLAIWAHDPHLEFPISWWIVHIMLARRGGSVWNWFFNDYQERSFDRTHCVESFNRYVKEKSTNQTTTSVIQRDIACLLISYAVPSANERPDPEDATICPLRGLSLVMKHSDTGRFERTRPLDRVPVEAFLAATALLAEDMESDSVALSDLLRRRNSPGRILGLDGDMLDDMATQAANIYGSLGVNIVMLGSNRTLTIPRLPPDLWFERHFSRIGAAR